MLVLKHLQLRQVCQVAVHAVNRVDQNQHAGVLFPDPFQERVQILGIIVEPHPAIGPGEGYAVHDAPMHQAVHEGYVALTDGRL